MMAISMLEAEFKQILLNLLVDCWPFIPDINSRPTTKTICDNGKNDTITI